MKMVSLFNLHAKFVACKQLSISVDSNNFIKFGPRVRFDWGDQVKSGKMIRYYLDFSAN